MEQKMKRFDPIIQRELDAIKKKNIPFIIEKGTKHLHIKIAGKLVSVITNERNTHKRMAMNCRANIRRFLKENGLA